MFNKKKKTVKHNIIKTDNYLLVVDESEIKTWYYDEYSKKVHHSGGAEYSRNDITKNIVAHLPLNGYGILEGVPLLPPFEVEDNVEKMAKNATKIYVNEREKQTVYLEFINGYNKAKEKYKFTEEDVLGAIEIGFEIGKSFNDDEPNVGLGWLVHQKDNYIQSLSQPKTPTHFQFEMVDFEVDMGLGEECIEYGQYPKTTTNSQGQTQVVGRYIYE